MMYAILISVFSFLSRCTLNRCTINICLISFCYLSFHLVTTSSHHLFFNLILSLPFSFLYTTFLSFCDVSFHLVTIPQYPYINSFLLLSLLHMIHWLVLSSPSSVTLFLFLFQHIFHSILLTEESKREKPRQQPLCWPVCCLVLKETTLNSQVPIC